MKNWSVVLIILLGVNNLLLSQNFSVGIDEENLHINEQVEIDLQYGAKTVAIKLVMINELNLGYYSLVRVQKNGKVEKIATEKIIINSISKQTVYELIDSKPLLENVVYTLYRVTKGEGKIKKSHVVQRWQYHPGNSEVFTENNLAKTND